MMTKKTPLLIYTVIWVIALAICTALLVQNIGDARIINYSGMVRGATQRVVKEELNGNSDDALIAKLDGIIENLETGKGEYSLRKNKSVKYNMQLAELKEKWTAIKEQIYLLREEREAGTENGAAADTLYRYSQEHFDLADKLVVTAEEYSTYKLWGSIVFLAVYLVVTVAVFAFFYIRNRKDIEESFITDRLTDIYNRNGFEVKVAEILKSKAVGDLVMVKFDVDDFKFVNSAYGHTGGDGLLKNIAAELKNSGNIFACARIDADDFMILARRNDAIVDGLRSLLSEAVKKGGNIGMADNVTYTFGICEVGKETSVKKLIDNTSIAHKIAKAGGKNCVIKYDRALLEKLQENKDLSDRIGIALKSGEVKMYLQPKFDIREMKMIGAEALVRWEYPDKGLILPDKFVPLFESNGLIYDVDIYMLSKACAHIAETMARGLEPVPISVNFSRVTLYRKGFIDNFRKTVASYRVPPHLIEIEITESAFNGISETVAADLVELRKEGYRISVDDFGSGYSSLNMLNTLHLDTLKLDRDFLRVFSDDGGEQAKRIINCVVELAHALNMTVICEGIETGDHLDFLRGINCNYGQGFYYSKPIDEGTFADNFYKGTGTL